MKSKHALVALIEDTVERNHWTQESVVERARSSEFRMSTQNLSRVKNSPVTTLVPEQVRDIAAGLQLPVSVIPGATLESLGFTSEPSRQLGVEEAVKYDHGLSARDRRVLAAVVTELLATDGEGAMDNAKHPAPTYRAGDAGNNVRDLTPDGQAEPTPPLDAAARDLGRPSRGQQICERQDVAGERPDIEAGER